MIFLNSGYFQDGLKALVYFVPFIYVVLKKESLKLRYFWLFFIGLSLLFFGHFVDFLDEFEFLKGVFPVEKYGLLQDFFEDMIGFTLGFVVFIWAVYMEFKKEPRK